MITFKVENILHIIEEVQDLINSHWEEIARNKELIKLNPDWDKYGRLQEQGNFLCFTARDDNKLIGYAWFFVDNHLHYKDNLFAQNDIFFISKDHRGKMTGIRLLKYCEDFLRDIGVDILHMRVKLINNFGEILERIDYTKVENVYERVL